MTDKEKEMNAKVKRARLMLHHIMRDADNERLYDNLVDIDKELYEIRDMLLDTIMQEDTSGND